MNGIELLDATSNAAIAKLDSRQFPGLLLQGDSVKVILNDIAELRDELEAKDVVAATEIAHSLFSTFEELLRHYERVLAINGLPLPYTGSVGAEE